MYRPGFGVTQEKGTLVEIKAGSVLKSKQAAELRAGVFKFKLTGILLL